jgi:tetratricopeptide (TPR) repeat protein
VTQQALALCEAASDQAGIDAYRKNLDVIRGRGELVMYDLGEGRTSWEIRGGDPVPDEAEDLHHEGREAGTRGDHQQALALFTRAAALAPRWPYPLYDRAYTHLLMKNDAAALADYERVLELSPRGFFTAHVAADTLRREAGGQLMSGLFRAYSMLEHMDEEQRRRIVAQLVEKEPQFAPGWLKWAALAGDPREQLAALERGLAANPDPSTRGMLLLNKAARLQGSGDRDGAVAILRALAADPASTEQSEALAKDSLRRLGAPSELERA